jgi:hypothetical protein
MPARRSADTTPRYGGSFSLENPDHDARSADIFWSPAICSAVLPVVALNDGAVTSPRRRPPIGVRASALVTADGLRHLRLYRDTRALQLRIEAFGSLADARLFVDVAQHATAGPSRIQAIRQLSDLMATGALRSELHPPPQQVSRLALVLQALDGFLAGATQREIAVALFGPAVVAREWSNIDGPLRDRVRRAVRRGRDLIEGGYRRLLL